VVYAVALCFNPEVAGSIPDGDIEIFHLFYSSGCSMTLSWIQTLTEMSTKDVKVKASGV
jgi:hypothetical protein